MRLHTWFGLIVWSGNIEKYTSICYDICQTITTFQIETHSAVSRAKCKKADFSTWLFSFPELRLNILSLRCMVKVLFFRKFDGAQKIFQITKYLKLEFLKLDFQADPSGCNFV